MGPEDWGRASLGEGGEGGGGPRARKRKGEIVRSQLQLQGRAPPLTAVRGNSPVLCLHGARRLADAVACCTATPTPRSRRAGDNELITLEVIHEFVEVLDKYFGNVCELDLIFNFHKARAWGGEPTGDLAFSLFREGHQSHSDGPGRGQGGQPLTATAHPHAPGPPLRCVGRLPPRPSLCRRRHRPILFWTSCCWPGSCRSRPSARCCKRWKPRTSSWSRSRPGSPTRRSSSRGPADEGARRACCRSVAAPVDVTERRASPRHCCRPGPSGWRGGRPRQCHTSQTPSILQKS